jgi:molybdate transport system substrate-binding protein
MKKICLLLLFTFCILLIGCGQTKSSPTVEITVSAAASLKDVLLEIQRNYQIKHPTVKINYNLGASGALQKQIEEGAPVDIFISAATKQMDDLEKKNLIKIESRKNLVENQLVLIVPKDSTLQLASFEELKQETIHKFAMGAPESVPAGQYVQQVLKKFKLLDDLEGKIILAKDVRTVLTYVETGNVEVGAVYKTDALISTKVKIILTAPAPYHDPILYPMAILASSKENKATQDFCTYLASAEASASFEKYGFIPIKN